MFILSPSRLVNGNDSYSKQNQKNVGLPPPESPDQLLTKNKKRFGRRKKTKEIENDKINTSYPPKFTQTNDRSLNFGDNSFDADQDAYNLYAFIVRIKDLIMKYNIVFLSYSVIMEASVVDIMLHLLKIILINNGIVLMIVHAK